MTLKAYTVLEDTENTGGIVFARSSAEARREGSCEFGDGDFNWGKARRAPWADEYAPGPVPWKVLFDHGWWTKCDGCGCTIQEGACDDDCNEREFDIVEVGAAVYCTPECRERHLAEQEEHARIASVVIAHLTDRVLRACPGAIIAPHAHVYVRPGQARPHAVEVALVSFVFPGCRYGAAQLRFDRGDGPPTFSICRGDRIAFSRWAAAGYPPHMMDSAAEGCAA